MKLTLVIILLFLISAACIAEVTEENIQQVGRIIEKSIQEIKQITKPTIGDRIKEWMLIVFTGILAFATFKLRSATIRYANATERLVEVTQEYTQATKQMAETSDIHGLNALIQASKTDSPIIDFLPDREIITPILREIERKLRTKASGVPPERAGRE